MAKRAKRKKIKKTSKTTSLFLGIVVIISLLVAINSFFTSISQQPQPEKSKAVLTIVKKPIEEPKNEQISYLVKKNDNLSKMAKNLCGNKSEWVLLAEKNNLMPPYVLHEGESLTISCSK